MFKRENQEQLMRRLDNGSVAMLVTAQSPCPSLKFPAAEPLRGIGLIRARKPLEIALPDTTPIAISSDSSPSSRGIDTGYKRRERCLPAAMCIMCQKVRCI